MSKNDDATGLLVILGGIWLLSKWYEDRIVPALQQGGVTAYEWLHNDQGHKRDLPGHQLTKQLVLDIATRAGFPDPKLATAIAFAESGGVPGAVTRSSRENSIGLWQINLLAHPQYFEDDMKDPEKNANAAFAISHAGTNWKPWAAYTNGSYKRHQTGILAP